MPVVFPVHPRTRNRLREFGLDGGLEGVILTEPLGYIDFLALTSHASLILTDSGGLQEESTALGIPCLTLRENTERPVTVTDGTNRVVGTKTADIVAGVEAGARVDGGQANPRAVGRPRRRAHRRGADPVPVRVSEFFEECGAPPERRRARSRRAWSRWARRGCSSRGRASIRIC